MIEHYLPPLSPAGARWARFLAVVAAALLVGWLVYRLRVVLTPIALAVAFAYILNPVLTWLERRSIQRITSLLLLSLIGLTLAVIAAFVLVPLTIRQLTDLVENLPRYFEAVQNAFINWSVWARTLLPGAATQPATQPTTSPAQPLADLIRQHGLATARAALAYLTTWISSLTTWIAAAVLVPVYTFFFAWRFNEIVIAIRDHLPAAYRPTIVRVVTTIDRATANFFRGRVIVCSVIGALLATGWSIVGVPYSIPLGVAGGLFSLVPFLSGLTLPAAILLTLFDPARVGGDWLWPTAAVLIVFVIVQAIEGLVLSPIIEGQSSGLHPITTVIALLVGAELAGLLGMLLSIPATSTLKSLAQEFLMPEIRRLAGRPPQPPPPDQPKAS